jgi:WD40 repeat protein
VRFWDIASRRELAFLPLGWTHNLAFTSDGKRVLTCTDANLQEWPFTFLPDRNTLELGQPHTLSAPGAVFEVSLSADGAFAYAQDGKIHLGGPRPQPEREPFATANFGFIHVTMSPDGKLLVASGRPASEFQVWEVAAGKIVKRFGGVGNGFARFSPNGQWLGLGDNYGYRIVQVSTWKPLFSIHKEDDQVYDLVFSPDSKVLAVVHSETIVQLLDTETGLELATLEPPDARLVNWLAFYPDGSQLAVGCNSRQTQIWDLRLIRQKLSAMNLDWGAPPRPLVNH